MSALDSGSYGRRSNAELRRRLEAFESGQIFQDMGRRIGELEAALAYLREDAGRRWQLEKTLRDAREEVLAMAGERDRLAAERLALAHLLDDDGFSCGGDCATCPDQGDFRCLLYIGEDAPFAQYRALAGRLGFRLLHHPARSIALPDDAFWRLVEHADAIVDATQLSGAGRLLQRHCELAGKPCLPAAGRGSFALALSQLAARLDAGDALIDRPGATAPHHELETRR